jgi:DNA polymerase-3 subunit beta
VRCASRDEARPILTGVLVHAKEDTLTLASTDGHRLAVRVIPATVPAGLVGTSVIIPARALERLAKVRVSPESVVTVALAEAGNHVHFTVGDVEMASQVIEGTYPTYEPVIPTDAPTMVRATTTLLLREVRTTSVLSPDAVGLITVVAGDGGLTLRAQAAEIGQDEARVEADVTGPEVTIGFNAAYLRTALETVEAAEVTLGLSDALKPAVIRPAGDDSFLHVVMPIRVS